MNTIIAYQPSNCCFLFKEKPDYQGVWRGMIDDVFQAYQTTRPIVAKWTIRLKQ